MKYFISFLFILLTMLFSVGFAAEDNFKDTNYDFSKLKTIDLYYIGYERTNGYKNFIPYKNPEPDILDVLTNKKNAKIVTGKLGKSKAYLIVEIHCIGTDNNVSRGEIEFIIIERRSENVIYRHKFDCTLSGSCEDVITSICNEFLNEL